MTDRALSPVVGTLGLVGLVVVTAAVVAASPLAAAGPFAVGAAQPSAAAGTADAPPSATGARDRSAPAPTAFSLAVDGDRIALTYERGPTLDVARLRVRVVVDGDPLARQPPVPFFAARGFRGGPTGPFNVAGDGAWRAGETAAFEVAATNDPSLEPGGTVTVRLHDGESTRPLATLTASVGEP